MNNKREGVYIETESAEEGLARLLAGLAFVECDEVVVKESDWMAARHGDVAARSRLRQAINGLELYSHAIPIVEGECIKTIREIDDMVSIFIRIESVHRA